MRLVIYQYRDGSDQGTWWVQEDYYGLGIDLARWALFSHIKRNEYGFRVTHTSDEFGTRWVISGGSWEWNRMAAELRIKRCTERESIRIKGTQH